MARIKSEVIHKGLIRNGRFVWDRPEVVTKAMEALEGKRIKASFEEEDNDISRSQFGYYFGGIIRNTCLRSEIFKGWSVEEIDNHFRTKFLSLQNMKEMKLPDGRIRLVRIISHMSFEDISKDEMTEFIEKVIEELNSHDIHPLSPDEYNLKKYS